MIYLENPRRRRHHRRRRKGGHRAGCTCGFCRKAYGGHRRRAGSRHRRRYRRNPYAALTGNPRHHRRRHHRGHRRHHRRRRYGHNPSLSVGGITRQFTSAMPKVGWGIAGALGTNLIPGQLARFVPQVAADKASSPITYYGVRLGSAWLTSYLIRLLGGSAAAESAFIGGLLATGAELVQQYALGPLGLSTYLDTFIEPGTMGDPFLSPGVSVPSFEDFGDSFEVAAGEAYQPTRLQAGERF